MILSSFYLTIFWLVSCLLVGNYGDENERQLLKYLFDPSRSDAHNIMERPVQNKSNSVVVEMTFSLIELKKVDERKRSMEVLMWISMNWKDYHFYWDPAVYDGLSKINIPSEKIWIPDILLYNSGTDKFTVTYPVQVISEYTTSMLWVPPAIFKSECLMDVSSFPFDIQRCSLQFGSWTYNKNLVDIQLQCFPIVCASDNCTKSEVLNLDNYKMNEYFDIIENYVTRSEIKYCNESYVEISVNIGIQRKSKYYVYTLIIPCILLSILTFLIFTLPPDSKERITLGVVILLIFLMLLLLISSKLPLSSNTVPMISKYFLCVMILCFLSIICSIFVLNCHEQSKHERSLSVWIKDFTNNSLAKIVFMKFETLTNESQDNSSEMKQFEIGKEYSKLEVKDGIRAEWRFAARVLDRYCVILFAFATIVSTILFFSAALSSKRIVV